MAEFVQTIKDWGRMCLSDKSCGDCPMMDADGRAHILCSEGGIQIAVPEIQEAVIEKWAAEHPEPVYPTWYQWLANMNVVPIELPPEQAVVVTDIGLLKNIPADIADRLGIEPKEG